MSFQESSPPPEPGLAERLAESAQERAELAETLREGQWDVVVGKLADLWTDFLAFLPLLGVAFVVFVLFVWLGRVAGRWERPYRRLSRNRFVQDLLRQGARSAVLFLGVLVALEILGATGAAAAVLGTAGVLGLAVGFAFKDLVENYIAGVLLSLRQPFEPNDHVVIDGREGKVLRLTSRAAILMTLDGNHLRIPNAAVFKGVILNYSRNPRRRFEFAVGVGSGEDLGAALRLGIETLAGVPGVLADPEPWAQIEALGDSSVTVRFYAWIDQRESSFPHVRTEALRRVKEALEGAGMDLPEPIYRVRMEAPPAGRPERPVRAEPEAPTEPAEPTPTPSPAAPTDAHDAIDRQIAEERAETPGDEDLLRAEAPKE
jgi:small-conductance mechanosensitive channel